MILVTEACLGKEGAEQVSETIGEKRAGTKRW